MNSQEFTDVYRGCYPAVLAFLRRRVPADKAEDLAADVFGRAWRGAHTRQGEPLPWLYGIARNVMREFYRAHARHPEHAVHAEEQPDVPVADFAALVDLNLDINRALVALSASEREVLLLHAWEGLEPAEIAQALDISPANARVRLHRARTRLTQILNNQPKDDHHEHI